MHIYVHAQSLQSCLTLCDPMDYNPPGSSVHGDSPGKNTGVGCHALLQRIFPTQGWNSWLLHPALAGRFFTTSTTWETHGLIQFSSVQSLSRVRLHAIPWAAGCQASLSITNSWSLLKPMSVDSMTPSNHLILYHLLFLPPSIFPSSRVFTSESVLHIRWPKYWSFSFSISPSNEYSGRISFWMNWLDLLAVQRTLKSFQHHSSKAWVLQHSAFFIVQLSHPYMTTRKTIALTIQTFVMSLLFNMLSRLVITFLPRSKRLLTSLLQSLSAVILEPPQK